MPRDENGSTLVLTAPDPTEDYLALVWVARDLEPGPHTLTLVADRGWDQWALNGFSVLYRPNDTAYRWGLVGWAAAAISFLALAIYTGRRADWGRLGQTISLAYHRLSLTGQLFLTGLAGLLVGVGGWLTWGAQMEGLYRRLGEGGQIGLTVAAAFLFYVAPSFYLYSLGLITLFVLLYLRPTWGLVLIAFTIPFRLVWSKTISQYTFSLLEIFTVLTAAAFLLKFRVSSFKFRVSRADGAVLGLLVIGTLSLFFTERLDVATNEWRWLIVEPVLFYAVFRLSQLTRTEFWLILDAFILGGLVMALIGLFQYATGSDQLITAEGADAVTLCLRFTQQCGPLPGAGFADSRGGGVVGSFEFQVSSFEFQVSSLQSPVSLCTQHATRHTPLVLPRGRVPHASGFSPHLQQGGHITGFASRFFGAVCYLATASRAAGVALAGGVGCGWGHWFAGSDANPGFRLGG